MKIVSAADLFVMPNIKVKGDTEGFGLVALEASLRSTPVLASNIEGITDAVTDGENGLLLESKNTRQWINAIQGLLSDDSKLFSLSNNAKEYVMANYNWDEMVESYYFHFENLINR